MARARPIRTHVCIIEITGLLFVKTILLRDLYKTRNFIATAMLSDVHITEFDENNYLLSDGSRFLGSDSGKHAQSTTSDVGCCVALCKPLTAAMIFCCLIFDVCGSFS
jgi:hypothetical protein